MTYHNAKLVYSSSYAIHETRATAGESDLYSGILSIGNPSLFISLTTGEGHATKANENIRHKN